MSQVKTPMELIVTPNLIQVHDQFTFSETESLFLINKKI